MGRIVDGSEERLLDRATHGDDIALYEESSSFSCYIVFANHIVSSDRVSGLSLPHMAHGEFADPDALMKTSLTTIQYIYDSKSKNLLCKDMLDEQHTLTSIWANNPHYSSLAWYSTRRYAEAHPDDPDSLNAHADQIKVKLKLHDDFKVVFKPTNIRFLNGGRDFLIKSSPMILPTRFVLNPKEYLAEGRPLIANKTFSLAYLDLGSDQTLTIIHKQRYSVLEDIDEALECAMRGSWPTAHFEGRQSSQAGSITGVARLECEFKILVSDESD